MNAWEKSIKSTEFNKFYLLPPTIRKNVPTCMKELDKFLGKNNGDVTNGNRRK